jgi:hypothetical protein
MRRLVFVLATFLLAIGVSAGAANPATAAAPAWRTQHVPVPGHFLTTSLAKVSCSSSTFCATVGSVSAVWGGSSWHLTPNASGQFAAADLSCATRVSCVAVGNFTNSTTRFLYAEEWNGAKWSLTPNPVIPQQNEPGDSGAFTGVSCVTVFFCLAVGNVSNENNNGPFAEIWNGHHWALTKPMPTPKGSDPKETLSVSCASPIACLAVGFYYTDFAEKEYALADFWDGGSWVNVSPPQSKNADPLVAVSCASATWCMALGQESTGINPQPEHVAERWSDGRWTSYRQGSSFTALSCSSSKFCLTIGVTGDLPGYATWIGKTWSSIKIMNVGGQYASVSCTSNTSCTAVGQGSKTAVAARYSTKS